MFQIRPISTIVLSMLLAACGQGGDHSTAKESDVAKPVERREAKQTPSPKKDTTAAPLDSSILVEADSQVVSSIPKFIPQVFQLSSYSEEGNPVSGFISLTDMYPWARNPDSVVIAGRFLGDMPVENENYHKLNATRRAIFLEKLGFSESDSLFLYHFEAASLLRYSVASLPLIAFLNPYGGSMEIVESDYMIGFELPLEEVSEFDYSNCFASVAERNPFEVGGLKSIVWKAIDTSMFPDVSPNSARMQWLQGLQKDDCYKYAFGTYQVWAQNLISDDQLRTRHVLVTHNGSNEVLFNEVYFESEGSYLLPLNGSEPRSAIPAQQWIGRLFSAEEPVVFGFQGFSFGCITLGVLQKDHPGIWVKCDNRH